MSRIARLFILNAVVVFTSASAFGHCDAINGPVVSDARAAIESGNVEPVLKWIAPGDEPAIREAFDRTMSVRGESEEARALADLWFFETVVRVHRASEGAPYNGLRPGSYDPGIALRSGDESLENGSVEALEEMIVEEVRHGIRERFDRASRARELRSRDVESGRDYVESYAEFMHYVERLHRSATSDAAEHESLSEPPHEH